MDRENSLTLLWHEWGSKPIPSDLSEPVTGQCVVWAFAYIASYPTLPNSTRRCKKRVLYGGLYIASTQLLMGGSLCCEKSTFPNKHSRQSTTMGHSRTAISHKRKLRQQQARMKSQLNATAGARSDNFQHANVLL
jgi:hypothetical protein